MDDMIEHNKQYMTICLPDMTTDTKNPAMGICESMGVQMVGMSFQNFDSNMEYASLFFNKAGSAFSKTRTFTLCAGNCSSAKRTRSQLQLCIAPNCGCRRNRIWCLISESRRMSII